MLNPISVNDISKINIPDECKFLKIDVGLAGDAPNAAIWLSETSDRYVIGIEPLEYHWKHITKLGSPDGESLTTPWRIIQLEDNTIRENGKFVCQIQDRFCGILGAIDNIEKPIEQSFYVNKVGHTGSSSLLKPNIEGRFSHEVKVGTFSLKYLLDNIPRKFELVEHIKTDCEGKDFDVIKSLGDYIKKVVFVSSEVKNCHPEDWVGTQRPDEFISFMTNNNFSLLNDGGSNLDFVNNELKDHIEKYNLSCKTLGL